MKIRKLTERQLTEGELCTVERICRYTDNTSSCALIGDRVAVFIENEIASDTDGAMYSVKKIAEQALSSPPDFDEYLMDDGFGVITMCGGELIVISETEITPKRRTSDGSLKLDVCLKLRMAGLEACRELKPVCIVSCKD